MKIKLSQAEARRRARQIRLVLTDVDGVWTDTGVYYSDQGEAMKRFSIRDGMGVERLREAGIETGIVTGEKSLSVKHRAKKLRIEGVYLGVRDKQALLPSILEATGLRLFELAYIGDDCNDVALLASIAQGGLTAAPRDAMPEAIRASHRRCRVDGGSGAFRDFAEWILRLRSGGT